MQRVPIIFALAVCVCVTTTGAGATQPIVFFAETAGTIHHNATLCANNSNTTASPSSRDVSSASKAVLLNGSRVHITNLVCDRDGSSSACIGNGDVADAVRSILPRASHQRADPRCEAPAAGTEHVEHMLNLSNTAVRWTPLFAGAAGDWSGVASKLLICGHDIAMRRRRVGGEGFYTGIAVSFHDLPPSVCASLPATMFKAALYWLNATCTGNYVGDAPTMDSTATCTVGGPVRASTLAISMEGGGHVVLDVVDPETKSVCLRGHNSSDWEWLWLAPQALARHPFVVDVVSGRLGLPAPGDLAGNQSAKCSAPDCPFHTVYDPRSNTCIDVVCSLIWFKDEGCENRPVVVAIISLLIALIGLGELAIVYLRRQLDTKVVMLERRPAE